MVNKRGTAKWEAFVENGTRLNRDRWNERRKLGNSSHDEVETVKINNGDEINNDVDGKQTFAETGTLSDGIMQQSP